jgi:hypothetical protein
VTEIGSGFSRIPFPISGKDWRFISSPIYPYQIWSLPILLSSWEEAAKLTSHPNLVLRLRIGGAVQCIQSHVCLLEVPGKNKNYRPLLINTVIHCGYVKSVVLASV